MLLLGLPSEIVKLVDNGELYPGFGQSNFGYPYMVGDRFLELVVFLVECYVVVLLLVIVLIACLNYFVLYLFVFRFVRYNLIIVHFVLFLHDVLDLYFVLHLIIQY